jgi:hypothetical protein
MTTPRQPKSATLDIDALEREGDPGVFTFTLGGHEYEMADPQEMDYRDLLPIMEAAARGDITEALNGLLDPDEVTSFWENRIPAFKLNAICDGWLEHYGLNVGEAAASSSSSRGTAGRSKRTSRSRG